MILTPNDEAWIIALLPQRVRAFRMIYASHRDGWELKTWQDQAFGVGPTITLFKTDANKVCGGYTELSW
jgi:hypothetical protein